MYEINNNNSYFDDGSLQRCASKNGDVAPNSVFPQKRHFELLQLLKAQGHIRVQELAEHFGVSCETVRRDLKLLARRGLLGRTYGGAVARELPNGAVCPPSGLSQADIAAHNWAEARIAQSAGGLICDGETLLVSANPLTRLCVAQLRQAHLTIITNDLGLAAVVPTAHNVYVLGGQYEPQTQSTVGPVTVLGLRVHADCALIAIDGITLEQGFSVCRLEEALVSSATIASGRRTIALAPSRAFGENAFARIGPLECVQALVTDQAPPSGLQDALASARVNVVVAAGE